MNLSGIVVVARAQRHDAVVEALGALEGVEVHQIDEATGRIVVVQEAGDIHAEIDGLKRIKALPDVVMAEMVYHYLADDSRVDQEFSVDLGGQDTAYTVPASLCD